MTVNQPYIQRLIESLEAVVNNWDTAIFEDKCDFTIADIFYLISLLKTLLES